MPESSHPRENVWDYPRPPRLERVDWPIRVEHAGAVIAATDRALRVLETTHPPVYYVPRDHVVAAHVRASGRPATGCEWKGRAHYVDVVVGDAVAEAAGWYYPEPVARFAALRDAIAFYPSRLDSCTVDGEPVRAQDGDSYGGWITSWIDGGERGFKGGPGTFGWSITVRGGGQVLDSGAPPWKSAAGASEPDGSAAPET